MPALHLQIRRGADRFVSRAPGLISRHTFSFGEFYDPDHVGHGALMVNNHDVVAGGFGYDDHPHADAEILTWVLSGTLQHVDSSGHRGLVHRGLAQRMSAGSGIVHAERNDPFRDGPDRTPEPVEFVQMWLRPDEAGTAPSYQQREVAVADLDRHWLPVASGGRTDAAVDLGSAGSTLWATVLAPGVTRTLPEAALTHLYLARGEVTVEEVGALRAGDSVRLEGAAALAVTARTGAELLVWSMAR